MQNMKGWGREAVDAEFRRIIATMTDDQLEMHTYSEMDSSVRNMFDEEISKRAANGHNDEHPEEAPRLLQG